MDTTTEAEAYAYMEATRWPTGPVCPHCGYARAYFLAPRSALGRATRRGKVSERRVWKCAQCRNQFSVLTGTALHGSKIPMRVWLSVIGRVCAAAEGVSARDIEREYGLTAKTARNMLRRFRDDPVLDFDEPFRLDGDPDDVLRALLAAPGAVEPEEQPPATGDEALQRLLDHA